jgi:hypothetical protein
LRLAQPPLQSSCPGEHGRRPLRSINCKSEEDYSRIPFTLPFSFKHYIASSSHCCARRRKVNHFTAAEICHEMKLGPGQLGDHTADRLAEQISRSLARRMARRREHTMLQVAPLGCPAAPGTLVTFFGAPLFESSVPQKTQSQRRIDKYVSCSWIVLHQERTKAMNVVTPADQITRLCGSPRVLPRLLMRLVKKP